MANTTDFNVCVDSGIKKQCEELYSELGMSLTVAINVFMRQSLRYGGLPFRLRKSKPNELTASAMLEAERIAHSVETKRYSDVEEALQELKK